jgi:hypothetical protein
MISIHNLNLKAIKNAELKKPRNGNNRLMQALQVVLILTIEFFKL